MKFPFLEAPTLLFATHRKPEFDEVHAATDQLALKQGRLANELLVFALTAKAHDPLDPSAVVPRAVKHHNFPRRGQVLHIALEVPLAALGVGGFFQRHQARTTRVQVLHEAFDGAALAGCISAFKQNHNALAGLFGPALQFE